VFEIKIVIHLRRAAFWRKFYVDIGRRRVEGG
jgi:hypothetical protein